MRFGIEIEADNGDQDEVYDKLRGDSRYNYTTDKYERYDEPYLDNVEAKGDGSLSSRGVECCPKEPLYAREIDGWVDGVTTVLRDAGMRATSRCGLHVHLDRGTMPPRVCRDFAVALGAWAYAVQAQSSKVKPSLFGTNRSRLMAQWCPAPSLSALSKLSTFTPKPIADYYGDGKTGVYWGSSAVGSGFASHYAAVSFSSNHNTIEVRMASGTLCAARIKRIVTALRVCRASVKLGRLGRELADVRMAAGANFNSNSYDTAYSYGGGSLHNAVMGLGMEVERITRLGVAAYSRNKRKTTAKQSPMTLPDGVLMLPLEDAEYTSASLTHFLGGN
jgi:hypothetical protein